MFPQRAKIRESGETLFLLNIQLQEQNQGDHTFTLRYVLCTSYNVTL